MLDHDITLFRESIVLKNGHAGCHTRYIAARHQVVRTTYSIRRRFLFWPSRREEETVLSIPPEISTEQELRTYVRRHRRHWLR